MVDPIKKITLQSGTVRYRAVVDVGYVPKRDKTTGEEVTDANGEPVMMRKQLTITRDTKEEVKNELARIRHEKATGDFILPSSMTMSELVDRYLTIKAEDLEESTIQGYRNVLCHVRERLGHIKVQELTGAHVKEFITWLLTSARRRGGTAGTGLRPSTIDGVLGRLRSVLRLAVEERIVARNVAESEFIRVPKAARKQDKRTHARPKPWAVAEVREFLVGVRDDRLFAPLLLGLMGLRPAEVAGLRWENIDFDAGTLTIAETRTMVGNKRVVLKETKTEAGERTLPIPRPVLLALLNLKVLQEAEKATQGSWYNCQPTPLMFVDEHGMPLNTRHLREHPYAQMARLGLRKVRLYDARHSCMTFLATSGVPDVILAAWAGHTNAGFTKRVYIHPTPDDLRVASDHLSTLLGVEDVADAA